MTTYHVKARDLVWEAAYMVGIPFWVLWGVYGEETSFGGDVTTSSAGAMGSFQFTARSKPGAAPYPMTNRINAKIFCEQARAAAQYLHWIWRENGRNWNSALNIYNSGLAGVGYGEREIRAKSTYNGTGPIWTSTTRNIAGILGGAFGPEPATAPTTGIQPTHAADPPDHSPKVRKSGETLGSTGTSFSGHANAMRNLLSQRTKH